MRPASLVALLALLAACAAGPPARSPSSPVVATVAPLRFRVAAPAGAVPMSGRILVAMSNAPQDKDPRELVRADTSTEVIATVNDVWYAAAHVERLAPGEPVLVDTELLTSPAPFAQAPSGTWRIAATFAPDMETGPSPAELASGVVERVMAKGQGGIVDLALEAAKTPPPLVDTEAMKIARAPSKRLSAFFGRPMTIDAVVLLPASYGKEPQRAYGTVYDLPGFGATMEGAARNEEKIRKRLVDSQEAEQVRVIVAGTFGFGHHGFIDSVVDGPWLSAFVDELVPYVETHFRVVKKPEARLIGGHSSGGWGSLWVVLHRPEAFAATWSTSPDPVDLRSFLGIDVTPQSKDNMFVAPDGKPHGSLRLGGRDTSTFERFFRYETVMGGVGPLASFEWEWSPRGMDGKPWPLFDRATGALQQDTLKAWEPYDIRKYLDANWTKLAPKLKGKLHLLCGGADNFYLDESFTKLCEFLAAKGSDATCELVPGRDHFDLFGDHTPNELAVRVAHERSATLAKAGVRVTP